MTFSPSHIPRGNNFANFKPFKRFFLVQNYIDLVHIAKGLIFVVQKYKNE